MDWGFLAGFTLGSAALFGYHMLYLYRLCTSQTEHYYNARRDMFMFMMEVGEIVQTSKEDKE
jgi:hypothetical protein